MEMEGDNSESESEFCFNRWAEAFGLNRDTTGVLVKEGCNTKKILEVLSPFAINKLGLSIGQGIAFRSGLKALGNHIGGRQTDSTLNSPPGNQAKRRREDDAQSVDSHPPSGQRGQEGIEQAAENELDQYLSGVGKKDHGDTNGRDTKYHEGPYGSDPRINLVLKSQRRKAQRITNFIPESVGKRLAAKNKERMSLIQDADGKFSIKTDDQLPGHLTLSEWGAANIRLMQHLLDSGELARTDIEYYNAYSLMIYELIESYEWASILAFDTRYRELQAHTGFPWGTPSRGLEVSTLIPRARKERQGDKPKARINPRADRRGVCRTYARDGTCPYGEKCIFSHKVARLDNPKKER